MESQTPPPSSSNASEATKAIDSVDSGARFAKALALAERAHAGQFRKGTPLPYIEHPKGVAERVGAYGGSEDQVIAALLHDVLEGGGEPFRAEIAEFGPVVLRMVLDCSDTVPAAGGTKPPWKARKEAYLAHLVLVEEDSLLVAACDKLFNLHAILDDHKAIGGEVFDRFTASRAEVLWYYRELGRVFALRRPAPAVEYFEVLEELNARVAASA